MKTLLPLLCLLFLSLPSNARASLPEPLHLTTGVLTGTPTSLPTVRAFKGIPYAQPPIGPLRWHAPLPPLPWKDTRAADHFSAICPQAPYAPNSFYQLEFFQNPQPPMSEDCLYLNIWTAANSPDEKRPVMLWIHGGGGVQGYGSEPCFDGTALASHGVVLVTFNYRLGIFAHFAHPDLSSESDHHVSGNYAQLDQIAALHWLHDNIATFGGDPDNITLFGQSSGAASINRLLVSPPARGLFHKVILQSAAALNSRDSKTKLTDMEKRGLALAQSLHATSLDQLRTLSTDQLLAAAKQFKFDPNIDGYLLPDLAIDLFSAGKQASVPMLIGSNADEAPYTPVTAEKFRADLTPRFGPDIFQFYPADSDTQAAQSKHDERRDESFAGERTEALAQSQLHVPVYLYYFTHKPPGHDSAKYGAFHCAEIEYIFNTQGATDRPWEQPDRDLAATLIDAWTNFAKHANPNTLPNWPAYSPDSDTAMGLSPHPTPFHPDAPRLDFLARHLLIEAHERPN